MVTNKKKGGLVLLQPVKSFFAQLASPLRSLICTKQVNTFLSSPFAACHRQ